MLRSALKNGVRPQAVKADVAQAPPPPAPASARKVGLVVLHGVGETEPGYAVNTLLESLCTKVPGYTLSNKTSLQWASDSAPDKPDARFPVASRDAKHDNGLDITAIELHWADLTNLSPGTINATLASFRVIFESHHLVDAMLRRGHDAVVTVLRWLLWLAGWMMRGPIAALTIATSAYCIFLLFGPVIPEGSAAVGFMDTLLGGMRQRFSIVQAGVLIGSGFLLRWLLKNKEMTWYDTVFWCFITTVVLIALDLTELLATGLSKVWSLDWRKPVDVSACFASATYGACYIDGLYRVIIWGWRIYGGILIIALLVLLGRRSVALIAGQRDAALAPIAASIATIILQFMMWTTIVVTLLYGMLNRAEVIHDLRDVREGIVDLLQAQGVKPDSAALKLFQVPKVNFDWIDRFKFIYAMTAITVVISAIVAVGLVVIRRRTATRLAGDLEAASRKMPRVLFSPVLIGTLISLFLVLVGFIVSQRELEDFEQFKSARKWILPLAAFVAISVPLGIGHRAANFVHIARDLIDHQFALHNETMRWLLPWLFKGEHDRPRRAKIQQRLVKVLDLIAAEKGLSDIVFVAHSQGSVVAYDYMRAHLENHGAVADMRIQFLTFGSPLGHIYQKYFYEYRSDSEDWLKVARRVDHWSNLYRVDDPIGGYIKLPPQGDIDNVPLPPPGGHMNYWNDQHLAKALHAIVQLCATPAGRVAPDPSCIPQPAMPPLLPLPGVAN